MSRRRTLLLGVVVGAIGCAKASIAAPEPDSNVPIRSEAAPEAQAVASAGTRVAVTAEPPATSVTVPTPCTWKVGNSKTPPCRD